MLINEVCRICSLTKKAVEYYIEQGLVTPAVQDNGYRDFTYMEVARMKKISVLRNLGLSVPDIRAVLTGQENISPAQNCGGISAQNAIFNKILGQRQMEITWMQEKQALLAELARNQNWEEVQEKLRHLQKKQSVLERLRNAFPGYYGDLICTHFAPYLCEPVRTQEQQDAYDTIVTFLDNTQLVIPDDLQEFYDMMKAEFSGYDFEKMSTGVRSAVSDIETYLDENREVIEHYMEYTRTEEYRATPVYRMAEMLKQFNKESGYNDFFIPAMCRLSQSYRKYHESLQIADGKFLERYPNWGMRDKYDE